MQGEQVHSYLQQLQQKGSKEQPSCGNTKQVVYYKHTLTHYVVENSSKPSLRSVYCYYTTDIIT